MSSEEFIVADVLFVSRVMLSDIHSLIKTQLLYELISAPVLDLSDVYFITFSTWHFSEIIMCLSRGELGQDAAVPTRGIGTSI